MTTREQTAGSPRLTTAAILDAYIRLADRDGPQAATLRRLGAELGVDATAVYRHFRDKDAILEAVADRLLNELAERHRPAGEWRNDIRAMCIEGRQMYLAHPKLARVISASPEPLPGNMRIAEVAIGHLRSAGLSDREAALAYEALAAYVAGSSSLEADIGTESADQWRRRVAALDGATFPHAVAVADLLYRDDDAAFEFGLDLLLDGLEARASASGAGHGRMTMPPG
jgi:AcrR family transcriptional regulator